MTRSRIRRLGVADLHRLPVTCPGCPLGSGEQPGLDSRSQGAATWARAAEMQWGFCGVGIIQQDRIVGYLLVSPPLHVPRSLSGYGLNPDAAVLMTVRVLPEYAGHGLGRQLVQAAAARLSRTTFQALETLGALDGGSCVQPPIGFLQATGFTTIVPHPLHPRLRLELSRTVRWWPDLRLALDRLFDWVRPLPSAPARWTERRRLARHQPRL